MHMAAFETGEVSSSPRMLSGREEGLFGDQGRSTCRGGGHGWRSGVCLFISRTFLSRPPTSLPPWTHPCLAKPGCSSYQLVCSESTPLSWSPLKPGPSSACVWLQCHMLRSACGQDGLLGPGKHPELVSGQLTAGERTHDVHKSLRMARETAVRDSASRGGLCLAPRG